MTPDCLTIGADPADIAAALEIEYNTHVRALHRILMERFEDTPWPATEIDATPAAITDAILTRIAVTSALGQQSVVLADIVSVYGSTALYREEMPVAYFTDPALSFVVTVDQDTTAAVVRAYASRKIVGEHRVTAEQSLAVFVSGVLADAQG